MVMSFSLVMVFKQKVEMKAEYQTLPNRNSVGLGFKQKWRWKHT